MNRIVPGSRWARFAFIIIASVLAVFFGISVYLGSTLTSPERKPIELSPADLSLDYEDIAFDSLEDNIRLEGWLLPGTDFSRAVVIVHGADGNRADPSIGLMDMAHRLVENGFSVLTFDLRGHGESGGKRMSAGLYEQRDLGAAVVFLQAHGYEHIGVLGFSMGAVTSLLAAAENPAIDAVIADSSFADLADMMEPEFRKRTSFPVFFLSPLLSMVDLMYGVDFASIRPVETIGDISPRPVFIIHGEADDTVPVAHAERLYKAAGGENDRLWIVPGAGHVRAYRTEPEAYLEKITGFFRETLGSPVTAPPDAD